MDSHSVFTKSDRFIHRPLAGENIAVPLAGDVAQIDYIYNFNETAAFMLGRMDGKKSLGRIAQEMAEEYEVPMDQALADLQELCPELISANIIYENH